MKQNLFTFVLFVVMFVSNSFAQNINVTGTVTSSSDGSPLPGVNILVVGTTNGTQTDFDGKYTISASVGDVLRFSYLGLKTTEVTVGSSAVIDVQMEEDAEQLEGVVVTAFGIQQEARKLGYSVQDVKSDQLVQAADPNIGSALRGKLAGVNINSNAGGIGSSVGITVRGVSSLGVNNQPLIVLDGVIISSNQGGQGDFASGIDYGNTLSNLNPNDIENISLLKGGNATALYGFRGINGVLVITTKKGRSEKPVIEINSSVTANSVLVEPEFQNEYGQGFFDTSTNQLVYDITRSSSFGPRLDGTDRERFDGVGTAPYSAGDNGFKDFFQTGVSFLNSISISQGKENFDYRFSYSRSDDESVIPGSTLKRQNFSIKAGAQITDWLKITGKIDYINQDGRNRPELTGGQTNIVRALSLRPRNISNSLLRNNFLEPDGTPNNWAGAFITNPYYTVNTLLNQDETDRYISLLDVNVDIYKGLSALLRISQDHIVTSQQIFNPLGAFDIAGNGRFVDTNSTARNNNYDLIFTYNNSLNDDLSLGATFGLSHFDASFNSLQAVGETFLIPNFFSLNNFDSINVTPNSARNSSNSVFGSVTLGYKNYLFAEFTARNDWSSTLPIDEASFFYPSVGLSFVATDAIPSLQDSSWLSSLKLRGSFAQTGNATTAFSLINTFNISSNLFNGQRFFFLGTTEEGAGAGPALNNPGLVPEISNTFEFGVDARFLNNRIGLAATYYNIRTKDQILNLSLPPSSGAASQIINAGLVTNKGIEISVDADIIQNEDFKWSTNVNFTTNNNVVEELAQGVERNILVRQFNDVIQVAAEEGSSPQGLFGTTFERDDNGNVIFDSDGLPQVGEIDQIGDAAPDAFLNWSNTFTYKQFTLSFLLDARFGGDIFSLSEIQRHTQGTAIETLQGRDFFTGGQGIPVPADAVINGTLDPDVQARGVNPQNYWGRLGQIAENWVFDGSFVKFRELTFGYRFPKSFTDRLHLSNLSITYVGRNLAILHSNTDNFDPETGFNTSFGGVEFFGLPSASSHGLKLNITF
ncbi:SusC/RagA family TonB-linked outer membrane protein [Leptobacterium flavescens]|uniref:SusC/RagA family TonB-linked outer membrane protein n=1 Tax=Leptobacterium flavescens TaxID=472055 RepID=A0A6P0UPI9_9FLAO|nr:SusC/RagA family TonB-linked outer membrane protein [Leptobacterium flavescens]NER12833.1 SusC/RagA family TonB-linked outer membrane protein [Leptobacterium flavescens]